MLCYDKLCYVMLLCYVMREAHWTKEKKECLVSQGHKMGGGGGGVGASISLESLSFCLPHPQRLLWETAGKNKGVGKGKIKKLGIQGTMGVLSLAFSPAPRAFFHLSPFLCQNENERGLCTQESHFAIL